MIPKVDLISQYTGSFHIEPREDLPFELLLWIKTKVNDRFIGTMVETYTMSVVMNYINQDLYRLVEQDYIRRGFDNKWIVTRPLFKWVKG